MPSKRFNEIYPDGAPIFGDGKMNQYVICRQDGVICRPENYIDPTPELPAPFSGGIIEINGIRCLHLTSTEKRNGCAHMYLHEGGFTLHGLTSFMNKQPVNSLAAIYNLTGLEGFAPDYRSAPESMFPAGLNDCIDCYIGLLQSGYKSIVVGGESAGAGLAISLSLKLKDMGVKMPSALWCSSPVDEIIVNADDPMCFNMYRVYAGNTHPRDKYLSPIYGDFHGMPPMVITTGGGEYLSSGAIRLAEKAANAGVELLFHYGKDMCHCFPDINSDYPEAINAFTEIGHFICSILEAEE